MAKMANENVDKLKGAVSRLREVQMELDGDKEGMKLYCEIDEIMSSIEVIIDKQEEGA